MECCVVEHLQRSIDEAALIESWWSLCLPQLNTGYLRARPLRKQQSKEDQLLRSQPHPLASQQRVSSQIIKHFHKCNSGDTLTSMRKALIVYVHINAFLSSVINTSASRGLSVAVGVPQRHLSAGQLCWHVLPSTPPETSALHARAKRETTHGDTLRQWSTAHWASLCFHLVSSCLAPTCPC